MSEVLPLRRPAELVGGLHRLAQVELTWFQIANDELNAVDINDRIPFSMLIAKVIRILGPTEKVAEDMGVSATTVGRWISGSNLPPAYARPAVVKYLQGRIEDRLAELRSQLGVVLPTPGPITPKPGPRPRPIPSPEPIAASKKRKHG